MSFFRHCKKRSTMEMSFLRGVPSFLYIENCARPFEKQAAYDDFYAWVVSDDDYLFVYSREMLSVLQEDTVVARYTVKVPTSDFTGKVKFSLL